MAPVSLFCFPHAGGSAAFFYRRLGNLPGIHVCPVNLPGRDQRLKERPLESVQQMAAVASQQILEARLERVALLGYSLGSLVAFETAHRLRQGGSEVLCLFVAACRAPHLDPSEELLCDLPSERLWQELQARYGHVPLGAQQSQLRELLLPTLRADLRAAETYRCRDLPPLACSVVALGGNQDPRVSSADLAAWRKHTSGAFAQRLFPGDHFFLENCRESVGRTLLSQLAKQLSSR